MIFRHSQSCIRQYLKCENVLFFILNKKIFELFVPFFQCYLVSRGRRSVICHYVLGLVFESSYMGKTRYISNWQWYHSNCGNCLGLGLGK